MTGFKDHFGTDGLGDVLENSEIWKGQIQKEHAVHALIRLVNENQGEVSNNYLITLFISRILI